MYKYHYHKTVLQMLNIQKEYLLKDSKILDEEQATHILAGMVLHMEARGYQISLKEKNDLVGTSYNWHQNII